MHLFSDSMDGYAALADITTRWATKGSSGVSYNASGGRFGGGCIDLVATTSANIASGPIRTSFDAAGTARMSLGFSLKVSAPPSSAFSFLVLYDYRGGTAFTDSQAFRINANGTLGAYLYNSSTTQYSGVTNVCDGQWRWVEIDTFMTNGTGHIIIRVDGVIQVNYSGDTISGSSDPNLLDRLIFSGTNTITVSIDDLVVYDDIAGTTASDLRSSVNFPLGDKRMSLIKPDGAGSSTDFSASAGSNYQCVDETVSNSDTDYVQSTTVGHDDLYTFAALPVSPTSITGVAMTMVAKYTGTGGPDVKGKVKSSAATATDAARTLGPTYSPHRAFFARDPNTSAAWTESGVNAAEFGVELA